ncbi:MAG: proline dehydrogenase family protein, partial [Porticoccaceae bacterium]|nr:proline dehydrogenase family protein [Porticoccaceae bacterium]
DAEEADRLDISLDIFESLARDPELLGWDGLGFVLQAYGKRAPFVAQWLAELARDAGRKIMVRLVKGAYWDTEIKLAQEEGYKDFPVYTRKCNTDLSYQVCAAKLLEAQDVIYPQFATHNAHTAALILELAQEGTDGEPKDFEFQRLHGMGDLLHMQLAKGVDGHPAPVRVYAPVGAHKDLLPYLVRRLLENGANSSFVNQIVDENVPPEEVASDPFEAIAEPAKPLPTGPELFEPERVNSKGFDLQ